MLGRGLVQPLDPGWLATLDAVARAEGWPGTEDVAALGACVAALSRAYNDPTRARASAREAGAARLGFSFARDVPKGAAAVRELVALGRVARTRTLRVLDVGAGLGATTWGVVRALEAAGADAVVEAVWVDSDVEALRLASRIAAARVGVGSMEVRARTVSRGVGPLDDLGTFDLVLAGQVLSELDVGLEPAARVEKHASLLAGWLDARVAPGGTLVVIEPALRDRTRHLHHVRDALVARGARVFAPCLHAAPCPALAHEGDWCHEDLDVDLPAALAPVARAAGLRHEGLTFSYLVLCKDGVTLRDALHREGARSRLRVVSSPIVTKGKRELFVCGEVALPSGELGIARAKAMHLDRDASSAAGEAFSAAARGDLLVVTPPLDAERPRVRREADVALVRDGESR